MTVLPLTAVCDDRRLLGVKLHPRQRQLLESLQDTPNACWACGRRGGKTMLSSIVALYDALFRPDLDGLVRPGEPRYSVIVATNAEQAKIAIRSALLITKASPVLRRWLKAETADELTFDRDGVITVVRAMPCSSRGIRGYAVSTAIMDEAAFFVSLDEGDRAAASVYRALRPATAQFGHAGRMLVLSSPLGSTGWFADHWTKCDRGELAGWTSAQISTAELNPAIPQDFLADIERDEPDTFGSEYLALFESSGQAFFQMDRFAPDPMLDVAQPSDAVHWQAALDPALSSDAFGVALIGATDQGRLVVGPVEAIEPERKRGWTFELKRAARDRVLARVADTCKRYCANAVSDQHESQAIVARLSELGVNAHVVGMTREVKLAAFRELRDRLYDGSLVLPLHESLLSELARVQLKLEQGGAKIILPRSQHGHCDQVQALALCAHEMRFAAAGEGELIAGLSSHAIEVRELDPLPGGSLAPGLTSGLLTQQL